MRSTTQQLYWRIKENGKWKYRKIARYSNDIETARTYLAELMEE